MILIGTSGFSYEDWRGVFYPEHIKKSDMLSYYAQSFPVTEINASYYTIPGAASFAGMARKTPDNFEFVVKAHQDMTHIEKPNPATFEIFLGSIQPLRDAGKFGCMLAQYPWSFKCTDENADRLKDLRDRIGDLPGVIEFRNADWANEGTFDLLRELDFGFCCVDEPHLKGLMPPAAVAISQVGYVRFHGRNAKNWWKHDHAYERYDYLYTESELAEWKPRIIGIESETNKTYVFFNTHYKAKAVQSARMCAKMLGLPLPSGAIDPPAEGMLPF